MRPNLKAIEGKPQLKALPPPEPKMDAATPSAQVKTKEDQPAESQEIPTQIIPFEPNFDEETVSDVDLLMALCSIEGQVT